MLEELIGGALWGIGAGVVLSIIGGNQAERRPLMKSLVKAYVNITDRIGEVTAEARENIEDMYAEAKEEQRTTTRADLARAGLEAPEELQR